MKTRFNPLFPLAAWRTMLFEEAGEGTPGGDNGGDNDTTPAPSGDDTVAAQTGDDTAPASDDKSLLGKTGDDADPEPPAPEPITLDQLSLPEGFAIPDDIQEPFLEVINNSELSRTEMVNELIKLQSQASNSAAEQLWTTTQETWRQEAQALPEIGGDKFDQSLAEIKRGLDAAGATKEVYQALDITGAGNNPHIIQLMHKLTKPFREAGPVSGAPSQGTVDRASRMYPTMQNKD